MLFVAERHGPAGQGYCQGGFSADFTKVREIFVGVSPGSYIITSSQFLSGDIAVYMRSAEFV